MSLIILASMLLWGAVIHELNKPSKSKVNENDPFGIPQFFIYFNHHNFAFSNLIG